MITLSEYSDYVLFVCADALDCIVENLCSFINSELLGVRVEDPSFEKFSKVFSLLEFVEVLVELVFVIDFVGLL